MDHGGQLSLVLAYAFAYQRHLLLKDMRHSATVLDLVIEDLFCDATSVIVTMSFACVILDVQDTPDKEH